MSDRFNPATLAKQLTRRQLEILTLMREKAGTEKGELVYEWDAAQGVVGFTFVSSRTVFGLLRAAAIRADETSAEITRYTINETGRKILEIVRTVKRKA